MGVGKPWRTQDTGTVFNNCSNSFHTGKKKDKIQAAAHQKWLEKEKAVVGSAGVNKARICYPERHPNSSGEIKQELHIGHVLCTSERLSQLQI